MSSDEDQRTKHDFKFTGGKYKDHWLSDIDDLNYIKWFINNVKLNSKNKDIFFNRYTYLHDLKSKKAYCGLEGCEGCSC